MIRQRLLVSTTNENVLVPMRKDGVVVRQCRRLIQPPKVKFVAFALALVVQRRWERRHNKTRQASKAAPTIQGLKATDPRLGDLILEEQA
jgi:hypothetical protein